LGQVPVLAVLLLYLFRNMKLVPEYDFFGYLILGAIIWETSVTLFCLIAYVRRINVLSIPKLKSSDSKSEKLVEVTEESSEVIPAVRADPPRQELMELFDRIQKHFETEKPFLASGFRLESLSDALQVPPYLVSETINSCSEMHFFDFINSYRIAHARDLLKNEDIAGQFSQDAIAAMCGFSNKSSFYSAFKKFTGMTPLQYRKS
jgi:AraC-like DNA-binding protein